MEAPANPMDWFSLHWTQLLGWSALVTFLYRLYAIARRFVEALEGASEAKEDLNLIKTNHIPHLQSALDRVDSNITGLREDLRTGLSDMREDIRLVLMRME